MPPQGSIANQYGYGFNQMEPKLIAPMHGFGLPGQMYGFGINPFQPGPMHGFGSNQSQDASIQETKPDVISLSARIAAIESRLQINVKSEPKNDSVVIISDDEDNKKTKDNDDSSFTPKISSTVIKEEQE